jgi:hypothetical protein
VHKSSDFRSQVPANVAATTTSVVSSAGSHIDSSVVSARCVTRWSPSEPSTSTQVLMTVESVSTFVYYCLGISMFCFIVVVCGYTRR